MMMNPATLRRELREFGDALLSSGGSECITGDIDDVRAPCIRSVIQIDGDIITEIRSGAPSDDMAALIRSHRDDVDDWFGRLHRVLRDAHLWILGLLTVLPATVVAVATGSLISLLGLVGASVLSIVRRLDRVLRIVATAALGAVTIVAALWSRTPGWSSALAFWGASLVLVLVGSAAGYVAQRYVRRLLRQR